MAAKTLAPVTMRVKIGDAELEVSGPQQFVEDKVAEFVKTQGAGRVNSGRISFPSEMATIGHRDPKTTTLPQLLKKVTAKSDVDRVLVAGYYLEIVEQIERFTAAEVKAAIQKAKQPPPSNPSDVIAKNIKKGLIMQAGDKEGKLAYVLTTDGIETIEAQLQA